MWTIRKWNYCLQWLILSLAVLLVFGCSSDDDNPGGSLFTIADLEGNWEATRAVFTSVNANPQLQIEVVANGGTSTLTVSVNGNFTLVVTPVGENPQITTGQFFAVNNMLEAVLDTDPNNSVIWGFQLSNNSLMLQPAMDFDFDSNGSFQAATGDIDLVRQ